MTRHGTGGDAFNHAHALGPHMLPDTDHASYWITSAPDEGVDALEEDAEADVAIVGAGIVGLTCAYRLAKEGRDVLVIDRHALTRRTTGHTTAHLSHSLYPALTDIVDKHGVDKARAVWESTKFSIDLIDGVRRDEGIDCDFARVDGFLYAPRPEHEERFRRFVDTARDVGMSVEDAAPADLPFPATAAVRFPDQARFHPRKYLLALAQRIERLGGRVRGGNVVNLEKSDDGRLVVKLQNDHTVRTNDVVQATHVPFYKSPFSRMPQERSYVVGAWVPKASFPDALLWDTMDPYHYTRLQPGEDRDYLIHGGEDHTSGHAEDVAARWDRLEGGLRHDLDVEFEVADKWSAQDPSPPDGLAIIGPHTVSDVRTFIATGFHGWGMTRGTLAGWMIAERLLGRRTEWDTLYSPDRFDGETLDAYKSDDNAHMKKTKQHGEERARDASPLDALAPGAGMLVKVDEKTTAAVSRDKDGTLHAVDASCQHMGCPVAWNDGETSWDCPCHGSRYAVDGTLLDAPATKGLKSVDLERVREALAQRGEAGERRHEPHA